MVSKLDLDNSTSTTELYNRVPKKNHSVSLCVSTFVVLQAATELKVDAGTLVLSHDIPGNETIPRTSQSIKAAGCSG